MKSTLLAHSLMVSVLAFSAAAQTQIDLKNQSKNADFSAASSAKPFPTGTQLPATCSLGEMFFKTDAAAGQNLYACTSSNTWTLQSGSGGAPGTGGQADKVLSNDGSVTDWRALGGDVSGAPQSLVVGRIRGRSVASTGPGDGNVLRWNASASEWQPVSLSVLGGPNYSQSFTSQTAVTVLGSAHGLGTANLLVECYDNADPAARITPSSVTVNSSTFDVTITFSSTQTGRCVVNGSGGNSPVWSVFGRNGAVTPASGDYSFSQIAGTVSNSQVATGIDAVKIGAGTVSNNVFGYLANVSGDIQTQLNSKAVLATLMGTQLNDLAVGQTSATALTIGGACSAGTPCNARFGNTAYSYSQSCTANITAGSGMAYIYVSAAGLLTVGHHVTLTASAGCVAQPGVTSFPADSLPLYTWTATSGTWDTAGGHDYRAVLSAKNIAAGAGVATLDAGGRTTVSVDAAVVPTYLTGSATLDFPSIANGTCSADLTLTVPGAAVNNAVAAGWPAGLNAGLVGMMRVSAANTVAVRLCNFAGSAVDPASATFVATIVRSF
jgi:hypothetical protein